jgi:glycosyltransferase involved in cell wall biosynthesis
MKKKTILYVGNFLSVHGMNPNFNVFLVAKLKEEYKVIVASNKKNKFARLGNMLSALFLKRKEVDVIIIDVFSTTAFYFALGVALMANKLNIPYITILHGGNLPLRLKRNPNMCKAIFANAIHNISPSLYLENIFSKNNYSVSYIPNFINIDQYKFIQRSILSAKIIWVRSMHKIYNPVLAVKVLKVLRDKNINAQLCMVGPDKDGSLQDVVDMASILGVSEHLTLTGKLSLSDWTKLSENYDIFINTTNFDNHPVSLIEAMALGFPIISTDVGGIPYLIENNKNGLLVPFNDENAMAAEIMVLLNDNAKASNLSLKARYSAEKFDWKEVKQKWYNVIENVL